MFRFENLEIWRLGVNYGKELYRIADSLPQKELFGMGSQLRRVAVSISSNIAEGSGAVTIKDFKNFLDISVKSVLESVSQLLICEELGYVGKDKREALYEKADELVRKMRAFKNSLGKR